MRYSDLLRGGRSGDRVLVEARFSHPSRPALGPTQPPIQGYRVSFPGVKRPRRDVNHPPPSSAEVKERVELCPISTLGLHSLFLM